MQGFIHLTFFLTVVAIPLMGKVVVERIEYSDIPVTVTGCDLQRHCVLETNGCNKIIMCTFVQTCNSTVAVPPDPSCPTTPPPTTEGTTQPPVTLPPGCLKPFSCAGLPNGHHVNPWNCQTFYYCLGGQIYEQGHTPTPPPPSPGVGGKLKPCTPICQIIQHFPTTYNKRGNSFLSRKAGQDTFL